MIASSEALGPWARPGDPQGVKNIKNGTKQVHMVPFGMIIAQNRSTGLWEACGIPPGPQNRPANCCLGPLGPGALGPIILRSQDDLPLGPAYHPELVQRSVLCDSVEVGVSLC